MRTDLVGELAAEMGSFNDETKEGRWMHVYMDEDGGIASHSNHVDGGRRLREGNRELDSKIHL